MARFVASPTGSDSSPLEGLLHITINFESTTGDTFSGIHCNQRWCLQLRRAASPPSASRTFFLAVLWVFSLGLDTSSSSNPSVPDVPNAPERKRTRVRCSFQKRTTYFIRCSLIVVWMLLERRPQKYCTSMKRADVRGEESLVHDPSQGSVKMSFLQDSTSLL